jgi:hypothetical protein
MNRLLLILLLPVIAIASDFRGNLNVNYQGRESGPGTATSTFGQILNIYSNDRVFYSNDITLGAYIFHSKASDRDRADFRVRYTMNLVGYRYTLYSSYSPYTLYRPNGLAEKVRVFQISTNIKPKLLSDISSSYSSTRQFTTDHPRTRSGSNKIWNLGTQFSKSFGTFRGIYQRQSSKVDIPIPQEQTLQSINLGYDISHSGPVKIGWSASYNYTGTRNEVSQNLNDDSRTHLGSLQAGRNIGRWLSVSAAGSGRFSNYERGDNNTKIRDLLGNASASLKPRDNIALVFLRGYSATKSEEDTTIEIVNDYVNLGASLDFDTWHGGNGRLSASRAIYYESVLGHNNVDNATLIFAFQLYRATDVTLNLGASRNEKSPTGLGRYQMTRNVDLVSRPARQMTLNLNYQSSEASNTVNFKDRNTDNLSAGLSHTLKSYFNYTATYTYSTFHSENSSSLSVFSLAVNYKLSRTLSLLSTFSRRDLGNSEFVSAEPIDKTVTTRLSWIMTRRSNLTLNYSVAGINSLSQSQSYGGYFSTNF